MTTKVKIIIAVLVVAAIAGTCFYFFYLKPKQEADKKAATVKTPTATTANPTVTTPTTAVKLPTGVDSAETIKG